MKRPSFQFYPGDWLRDPVAGCCLAAQGLWLRMMIVAHDSDRYGYLEQNGVPMPSDAIARRCGVESVEQYSALISELREAGVPSRTPEGVIYSRRMVRDEELRNIRATAGSDSLKNPNVPRPNSKDGMKGTPKDTGKDTPKDPPKDGGKDTSGQPQDESTGPSLAPSLALSLAPSSGGSLGGSPSSSSSSSPLCDASAKDADSSRGNSSTTTKSKKPKPEKQTDPRYTLTRNFLAAAFREVCSATEPPPWDGHCAKELTNWLASHALELPAIEELVRSVARSENAKELLLDPARLIPRLRKYHVPLDHFGYPLDKATSGEPSRTGPPVITDTKVYRREQFERERQMRIASGVEEREERVEEP